MSDRKAGGEGPVYDCIADSCVNTMLGMRLRIKGESQLDNVKQLMGTLPTITSLYHALRLCFDCGYGKMAFLHETAKKNYNMATVANSIRSRHPFLLPTLVASKTIEWRGKYVSEEEINQRINVFKDYILESTEFGGASVRVATKKITINNCRRKKIYATAVCDIFDKKTCEVHTILFYW